MMKNSIVKKIICFVFIVNVACTAFSLDEGFIFGLRADFFGTLTTPSIPMDDLHYLNARATQMSGLLSGFILGGEIELGYIFKSPMKNPDAAFSGIGVSAYLGMSQGNTSQKISAVETNPNGTSFPFDIYMIVDFLPVVNFGLKGEALFFDNRFSIGLGVGGKAILDLSPAYLVYSTAPDIVATEVGEIIVTEEMITQMNPLALSLKFEMGYAIPVLPTTEFVVGWFTAYNFYSPKFLTVPPSLLEMAIKDNPDFDINRPFPDYWLNSLDFGVNIGLVFKL